MQNRPNAWYTNWSQLQIKELPAQMCAEFDSKSPCTLFTMSLSTQDDDHLVSETRPSVQSINSQGSMVLPQPFVVHP